MFHRYTESARRVIFFARYEAGSSGCKTINTEHLLLGLLRECTPLAERFEVAGTLESVRKRIEEQAAPGQPPPRSVDLPLTDDAKRVLKYANDESDSFGHREIDCGHLVLGLVRVRSLAATILEENGIELNAYRELVRNDIERRAITLPPLGSATNDELSKASGAKADSLCPAIRALEALLAMATPRLDSQPDHFGDQTLKRKPWTRKEALGHLVNLAAVHQQWFARALSEPRLDASGYPQEGWVSVQDYRSFPWQELVDLWVCMNRLLLHVLAVIPEEKLTLPCRIGVEEPVPLSKLIGKYSEDVQDTMGQILAHL